MGTTLEVTGMSCENCEESVETALRGVEGVTAAAADHEANTATVEGDADPLDLIIAVQEAGYEADA